jgi:hypothetical protein
LNCRPAKSTSPICAKVLEHSSAVTNPLVASALRVASRKPTCDTPRKQPGPANARYGRGGGQPETEGVSRSIEPAYQITPAKLQTLPFGYSRRWLEAWFLSDLIESRSDAVRVQIPLIKPYVRISRIFMRNGEKGQVG